MAAGWWLGTMLGAACQMTLVGEGGAQGWPGVLGGRWVVEADRWGLGKPCTPEVLCLGPRGQSEHPAEGDCPGLFGSLLGMGVGLEGWGGVRWASGSGAPWPSLLSVHFSSSSSLLPFLGGPLSMYLAPPSSVS